VHFHNFAKSIVLDAGIFASDVVDGLMMAVKHDFLLLVCEIAVGRIERVRVRMYRQGLGDCFLVRFAGPAGKPFHIVIDSGVIKGTQEPSIKMREVAEDIERETGGKIDVLVVTHEHWDHVSGFTEAREVWERTEINEAWLAWTEKPGDSLADKLRADRENRKTQIKNKITALTGGSSFRLDSVRSGRIDALLGFLGFGLTLDEGGAGGTKGALDYICKHAKKQTYHEPGTSFTLNEIPGLRIYVLGPPEDEKKIKKSDPSKVNPEVYSDPAEAFALSLVTEGDDADVDLPFGPDEGKVMEGLGAFEMCLKERFPKLIEDGTDPAWRRLDFESIADLERLALALDGDTNNTSLALAFELDDGRVLLFPADAQVGNWLSWQDYTWNVNAKNIRVDELLARTVFYKVGHHGSHNATLKDLGLEKMKHRDLVAFVPLNKEMAKKKRWEMPFPPLYERLQEKTRGRVVLADSSEALPNAEQLKNLTASEQARFAKMIASTDLFIDLTF
jgi:beta-lactamase superfamily II metal-dependent hydrolase